MPQFDIVGARKAGASDDDIKQYLSKYYDVNGAMKAGASLDDIVNHFNAKQQPVAPPVPNTPQLNIPKSNTVDAGTSGILPSPFAKAYSQQANQERGDIAKNVISFGLPMLATGLSAGTAIPVAGALGATGEALGTKVKDLITNTRTPNTDVLKNSAYAGLFNATGEGIGRGVVAGLTKLKAPFASGYLPQIDELAQSKGITLPASAVNTHRAVPLLESVSGKSAFGNKLTEMTMNAEKKVSGLADNFISTIDKSPDATTAGIKSAEGQAAFKNNFMNAKNQIYDAAKIKQGDVTVNPEQTNAILDQIIGDIKNSANPDRASLKYFQDLKNGLGAAENPVVAKLKSLNVPDNVIQKTLAEQGITAQSGVDGTKVLNTIKQLNRDINFNSTKPVATGFQSEIKKIGATLSGEFDTALRQSKPELATALDKADAFYKEGINKLNSSFSQKIKKFSDAGQYSKISEAILNKKTAVEDIPKIFEVVGKDAEPALKAELADRLIGENARNAANKFTPQSIDRTIKTFGEDKLKAIYGEDGFKALKDISKLSYAIGGAQRVAEGSQTAFIAKMSALGALAFTNPPLALHVLASDAAFSKLISSKFGQQIMKGGFKVSPFTQTAIPNATRVVTQKLGGQ